MSADLYTSEIDSHTFGDLFIEMKAGGSLRIIAYDPGCREICASFILPSAPEGWAEAENIIGALQEWVRHSKELKGENHER